MNNAQHSHRKHEQDEPDLDAALEALQAVVMAQKAQIDALLASLEGLLTAISAPSSSLDQVVHVQCAQSAALIEPSSLQTGLNASHLIPPVKSSYTQAEQGVSGTALLGNPLDPQFVSLHQLMGRLRSA